MTKSLATFILLHNGQLAGNDAGRGRASGGSVSLRSETFVSTLQYR
jgi:hypothetical protein